MQIIKTSKDCYKTLYSGEYVSCEVTTDSDNKRQATNVTGVNGGELMCENETVIHSREQRQNNRNNHRNRSSGDKKESGDRKESGDGNDDRRD